jgi:hypothetical protein
MTGGSGHIGDDFRAKTLRQRQAAVVLVALISGRLLLCKDSRSHG